MTGTIFDLLSTTNQEDVAVQTDNPTPPPSLSDDTSIFEMARSLPPPPLPESTQRFLRRTGARSIARGVEAVAGMPGDIRDFTTSLLGKGLKALGAPSDVVDRTQDLFPTVTGTLGQTPTSRQIREQGTQALTGEFLEPQTEGEELSDEIVGDLATLALPIKGKIPFLRALGTSLGANLGKETIKAMGGTEQQGQWGKLGFMFMLGSLGKGSARKYANNLFNEAIESIPSESRIGSPQFTKEVDDFISNLQKGGMSPQKQPAFGLARQLKQKIKQGGGEIPVDELPAFRKSLNDFRFNRKTGLTDQGRFYLDRFDDILNNQLMEYGNQNPSFLKKYRDANTAISGFKQSNKVARYISKHFDVNGLKPETLVLLGLHFTSPSTLAKIGGGIGIAKAGQLAKRVATNPVLRKHYENVIKDSLKGNAAAMSRNLKKLDDELGEEKEDN